MRQGGTCSHLRYDVSCVVSQWQTQDTLPFKLYIVLTIIVNHCFLHLPSAQYWYLVW